MKPTRGGKREGAGRKPMPESHRKITRSVSLDGDAWENLKSKANHEGSSVSMVVNKWAKRLSFKKRCQ